MLINDEQKLRGFLDDLLESVSSKKEELFKLNKNITLDIDLYIDKDFNTLVEYLKQFIEFHYSPNLMVKPKGRILIILSYNEPFILSVIPLLNALIVGNQVVVRPSKGCELFVQTIWTKELLQKYNLSLEIISKTYDEIESEIKESQSVYFFGSLKVAKKISELCGRNYVEFHPETETSDLKVFKQDKSAINEDVLLTLKESFSHSGQICQRIQGVFVHRYIFNEYVEALMAAFSSLDTNNFVNPHFFTERKQLIEQLQVDLELCNADRIVRNQQLLPVVVINPDKLSRLMSQAYFLPVLWVQSFDSLDQLLNELNSREFYLGINLHSNDQEFISNLIERTKFSRYTINTSHIKVRSNEGWGGSWPSGFSGYRDWICHFSNPYTLICD